MKTIYDIFPKKREKPVKEKLKIIADYREKNSLIISEIIKLGIEIEFKELKIGDYIVRDVVIERKTVNDFISSMINRRLISQIEDMKQYENKLLMIEGISDNELYNDNLKEGVHANSIRGFILSITLKHKIPIILTKNYEDSAKFIMLILKKKEEEILSQKSKKPTSKKEQIQFIIEGFPGIGPKNAKKLLNKFKTIKKIINASQKEIEETIGKKSEVFKLIDEMY